MRVWHVCGRLYELPPVPHIVVRGTERSQFVVALRGGILGTVALWI